MNWLSKSRAKRARNAPALLLLFFLLSCFNSKKSSASDMPGTGENPDMVTRAQVAAVMRNAQVPDYLHGKILPPDAALNPAFMGALAACLAGDRHLRELVDKRHPLPPGYVPADLVTLPGGAYQVNRAGLQMRRDAAEALAEMASAARADGVTLAASSAYRSYDYQEQVYSRIVREMGQEAADRESARPGRSQHQSGLALDFGSIDDSFAQTAAGRWMAAHAPRFGWSLSFPDGYEAVTGYRWESWHYRYVGTALAAFIENYFDGIQQYALQFLHEWENY